jgi:hypothetical protein
VSDDFKNLMALGAGELSDKEKAEHLIRCLELLNEACQIAPQDHPMGQLIVFGLAGLADCLKTYVDLAKADLARRQREEGDGE